MSQAIVVLNAGSSSIKFEVFDSDGHLSQRYEGLIEGIGTAPRFVAKDSAGTVLHETNWEAGPTGTNHSAALQQLADWLDPQLDEDGLLAVGHRVVHGGTSYTAPVLVDDAVLRDLETYIPLAPLHQPHNLAGIRAAMEFLPGVPNVACFDTSFHRSHPLVADQFALPGEFYEEGVRRYGFHGISYEYTAATLHFQSG